MCWQQKLTVFCNLATHSVDKTVEPPDPEKGQICKAEQEKLKIQMVTDWSVSAGLLVRKEYEYICKWGKHLNTEHTQTVVENILLKAYRPFVIKLRLWWGERQV
jgi:hypothetical protein